VSSQLALELPLSKGRTQQTSILKFEVKHVPNRAVPADRDPRERGSRPLNTDR
jgi:hypothetical protein